VGEGDIGKQYRALYFPIITERRAYARGGWRVLSARVCFFFFQNFPRGRMPSIATPAAVSSSQIPSRSFDRSVREEADIGFFKGQTPSPRGRKRMDQVLQIWFGLERLSALTYNSVFNKGPLR